ncbi:MAG TPA: hypothetical protein VF669_16605 [Tepidisphaeraceae bacterium]|jgi:hypothetical protein
MSPEPLDYRSSSPSPERASCPVCGSNLTVPGKLAGEVGFKPRKIRKFFSATGMLDVAAIACCACGAVTLHVDRAALVNLAGDPATPDSPAT